MDPGPVTVGFTRGDRARLLRVRFRGDDGTPWDWAGVSALFDCRAGDEASPRLFALTESATADGAVLLLADGWLEVWLEPARSASVAAGRYRFGLKIADSLGHPRTWLAGPCEARPAPTGAP